MKHFIATSLIVAASFSAWAADPLASKAQAKGVVSGEVMEVKNVDSYTYLRLKTKDGETWVAVSTAAVKKGATVTIENTMVMNNFESKTLKKTFPTIVFGSLGGAAGAASPSALGSKMAMLTAPDAAPVKVDKATGANAYTVADVVSKSVQLKD
ncbi:MAG: nucleotide-binding protein, partial [Rhodoferax sp.]